MSTNQDQASLAIQYWHEAAGLPGSFRDSVNRLAALNPWFLNTFGKAIIDAGLSNDQIRDAMQTLGSASEGTFPTSPVQLSPFYDALLGQVTGVKLWESIAVGTVKDTAAAVGSVAGFAWKGTVLVLIAALFLFSFEKGKN